MKNILDWIEENKQQFEGHEPRSTIPGPRNMYQDGQLVTPSVDGSRPGYNGLPMFVQKDPKSKSKPYRVKVKPSKKLDRDKFEGKFSTLKEAKAKAAEYTGGKPGVAPDPTIADDAKRVVERYNKQIADAVKNKDLSKMDFYETWLRKNYPKNSKMLENKTYRYNLDYTDLTKSREQLAKTLVKESKNLERVVRNQDIYDKLGFSRSAKASPIIRNIVNKGLGSPQEQIKNKVNLVFNNIVKYDSPINENLQKTISQRIGMSPTSGYHGTAWLKYLRDNPHYKKQKKLMEYTFSSNARIPGTTFSEMLDEGKYRIGGGVTWTGAQTKHAGARKTIMDYALTHWHRNNYDKGTSLIEFFDSKGNPIKWKPGLKLRLTNVQFKIPSESDKMWSYNGKPDGSFDVNGKNARASEIFDEVTAAYKTQHDIAGSWVTHPVSGEKVKYAELMDEVYRTGYGWTGKSTITGVDIDHFKGVKKHPFKNLRAMDTRMNIALGAIDKWIPNRNLKVRLKNELLGSLSTTTGSKHEKALKSNFKKQAHDVLVKGIIPEKKLWATTVEKTAKHKDIPQSQLKILQNIAKKKGLNITNKEAGFIATDMLKDFGKMGVKGVKLARWLQPELEPIFEGLFYQYAKQYQGLPHDLAREEFFLPKIIAKFFPDFYKTFIGPEFKTGILEGADPLIEKELYTHTDPREFVYFDGKEFKNPNFGKPTGKVDSKTLQYINALKDQERVYDVFDKKAGARDDFDLAEASADVRDLAKTGTISNINRILKPGSMASQAYNTAVEKHQALEDRRKEAALKKYDPRALERKQKSFDIYLKDKEGRFLLNDKGEKIENPRSLYKKRYKEMEEYKGDREGIFGVMSRKEYEKFQEEMPELKNIPYEDQPKFLQYLSTLKAKPEGSDKTYKELFPTPASRYGWDLMGEIARAGGVANMAGGGMVGIRKPNALPPTGGPQSGGLPSLYNNGRKL